MNRSQKYDYKTKDKILIDQSFDVWPVRPILVLSYLYSHFKHV